ncbi:hypothetical protein HETIRDRAFT_311978 [Heterobasidion irregulare TC 32-1]|uniref:Uncharacterized protein n=1 Tax=Heterobasidion irregulare (strain TC 32-1) TaxID=747525 RepID=W4KG38_HETIT|nr:uncharacterized protein HETIRDRAFT_311978 [Heterobasidion irregulare TC 32-1]ETW84813.1 hypothetical protein HETIRDRAFT_311978 [Heterobasidion irregulare TC 32-1]
MPSSLNPDPTILQLPEAVASKLKTIRFHHRGEQERIRSQLSPHIDLACQFVTSFDRIIFDLPFYDSFKKYAPV